MRSKGSTEDSKPSAPPWIATYGDMVTLLLVFFVLLFSLSTIDATKWKELVVSLSDSPEGIGTGSTMDSLSDDLKDVQPDDMNLPPSQDEENAGNEENETLPEEVDDFGQLYMRIKAYVDESDLKGQLELLKSDSEILIRFRDNVIFDSGKADIRPDAEIILGDIATVLMSYKEDINMIRIEGHTDKIPIHTVKYPSNWELSTARAVQVLRFFIERDGLDPRKLSAVGYGEYHPISENGKASDQFLNRRVDIVIAKVINVNK